MKLKHQKCLTEPQADELLKIGCPVIKEHPDHPGIVLIMGAWKPEELESVLKKGNFRLEVMDIDSRDLPFRWNAKH